MTKTRKLWALSICVHSLLASGCYTWKTVNNPTSIRRELRTTVRVTGPAGDRAEMVHGRASAVGLEFRSGELVPWDSIAKLEERRFSLLRTTAAVVGGYVAIVIPMAYFISGPEAIGLSARR